MTDKNEQIIIDTNKYFVELIDKGGGTIGYNVVYPERLLRDIIRQNKQLTNKLQECEELKEQLRRTRHIALNQTNNVNFYEKDNDRYRKALEDIEEYIYNNTDFDINDSIQSKTAGYDILQIIKDV